VVIGPSTRRLTGDLFDYEDLGAIEIKGLAAPIVASRVLRDSGAESRFEALRASATVLVGRDEELVMNWAHAWFHRAWLGHLDQALSYRRGAPAFRSGDPGSRADDRPDCRAVPSPEPPLLSQKPTSVWRSPPSTGSNTSG
jgi:hypothetical protein